MINILAQRWKVTDGRLVHVVHSNIQVMRGLWSGADLCSPVLRCSSTPPWSPSSSAICISRLLSSPSSELLGHLQIRFRHLPCPWLHRDAFLREVFAFPVQVPGLNWLSTSAAAAPHIRFSVLQLHGSLWKMSLCSGERLQGKTESHALVSLRIPYTDLETGDVFQIMPFYKIFSFFIFRTFAVLWRVLNYWCYEIYLGYLEKKVLIFWRSHYS